MPQDVYDAQSAELAQAVDALLDQRALLKPRLLLTIYDGGRHDAIGHVLNMRDGAVIVYRITNDYDQDGAEGIVDDLRQSPLRLMAPITGAPGQKFEMASRRTQFMVDADYLIRAIESGHGKVVLNPGWTR